MFNLYRILFKNFERIYLNYAVWQRRFFGTRALMPIRAYVSLTFKCNCFCYFCSYAANSCQDDFTGSPNRDELSFDAVKDLSDQLPKGMLMTLTGGEPTIAKDFFKIVEYVSKRQKVQVNTNAVTLNKEKIGKLIDCGTWIINFSIDSHQKELHDQIRGHQGLSQRIIESIEEIVRIKKQRGMKRPYIHVNTVVLKETMAHLPDMVKLCLCLGVDGLSFAPHRDGRGIYDYGEADLLVLKEKLRESVELAEASKMSLRLGEELRSVDSILKANGGPKRKMDMSPFACYAPWSTIWIRPDGTVRICRAVLGNMKNDRIKNLWNNQVARNLRRTFYFGESELSKECQGCCIINRKPAGVQKKGSAG